MDKDLATYKNQVDHRITRIEAELSNAKPAEHVRLVEEARIVFEVHSVRVQDFQHERLVHLLVTLFFAGLLLLSIAGGLFMLTIAAQPSGPILNLLAWVLCPILFVTEIFYVRHYYKLENGTQALYKLTDRLRVILDASLLR